MSNITGPLVTGDNFFDSESEMGRLRAAVEAGNNVLISAPRRVGKSSLMLKLAGVLEGAGWRVARADVQECSDEAEFVRKLLTELMVAGVQVPLGVKVMDKLRRFGRQFRGSKAKVAPVEIEVGAGETDVWKELARVVAPALDRAAAQGRLLIALDELPIFLANLSDQEDGLRRVASVLQWLRALRHREDAQVTWVLAGSVGLDSFVERRGLQGTINDLTTQTLGAYSDETAVAFLKWLGAKYREPVNMPDDVCAEIITRVGWPLPYYLQMVFCALLDRPDRRSAQGFPTRGDVGAAHDELLEHHHRFQFGHWDSRLEKQFDDPADAGIARYLLSHICQRPRGSARQKLFELLVARQPDADPDALDRRLKGLLNFLENDGYLLRDGNSYAFRSFLLRDYWKRWCA